MAKSGPAGRSVFSRKPNESMRLITITIIGVVFGFFIGISFPPVNITKLHFPSSILSSIEDRNSGITTQALLNHAWTSANTHDSNDPDWNNVENLKIYVPTNPRGAERLPPNIIVTESDLYPRRLWGIPSEDLPMKQKYLVTFTVGYDQKNNIDAAVKKFSGNFTIVLFHYDGRTSEWDEFEWSKTAIHVSARKQTKWWYAKRFLHPDIVAEYDYIFIWDEDLGVEHFNAEEYIKLVRKHGLEISQPGLEPNKGLTWQMTKRRGDREVHKETEEKPGWCADPQLPPCAAFVEIMAPVFSRDAWRCVWHMIQNDLVHGWGLDFALRKCVEPAHEKIGVVDSQWIVHQVVPSLGNQGHAENGATMATACQKLFEMGTKIIAVGRNYAAHAKELGNAVPKEPVLFMKPTSSYLRNGGTIEIPHALESLHYEVELAVVIGRKARDVAESSAMDYVGGYALALDMTAREIQASAKSAGLPWILAKGQDTFTPISEVLPKSMVADPHNLELWLKVDDEIKQKGSTSDMIFTLPFLISHISSFFTLMEGDVILTGTPQGVGPVKAGQKITAGITGLIDVHFDVQKRKAPIIH